MRSLFFAQSYDLKSVEEIYLKLSEIILLFADVPEIQIVFSELTDSDRKQLEEKNRDICLEIVKKSYHKIADCDVFVADFSDAIIYPIGMIFEMAFAYSQGKQIIIIANDRLITSRIFIIAHVDFVLSSYDELKKLIVMGCRPNNSLLS